MILKTIAERTEELAEAVDSSLALCIAFLARDHRELRLGEDISATLSQMDQLQRQLARLFRVQNLPSSPLNDRPSQQAQESIRLQLNAVRTQLGKLSPGDQVRFTEISGGLLRLMRQITVLRAG